MLDTIDNTGHNNPPAHVTWGQHADELSELAEGLTTITDAAQADSVAKIATDAKKALADVQKQVKAERKPHMDAAAAVSEAYKPAIATLERVKKATLALSEAWIAEQRRKEAEAAAAARRVQQEADEAARRAAAEADQTDVADLARAEEAEADAKMRAQKAKQAKAQKTTVAGIQYRTTGYDVSITDSRALWAHIHAVAPDDLDAMLHEWATRQARATKGAAIPGCTVEPIRKAV